LSDICADHGYGGASNLGADEEASVGIDELPVEWGCLKRLSERPWGGAGSPLGLSGVHRFPLGPLAEQCGARYGPAALTATDAAARLAPRGGSPRADQRRANRKRIPRALTRNGEWSGCLAVAEELGSSWNHRERSREASDRLLRWDLESPRPY
jgi:hypothetical protein